MSDEPIKRGTPFTDDEIRAARALAAVGRVPVSSHMLQTTGRILQMRGAITIHAVDYPNGKPLFADVTLAGGIMP